MAQCDQRMATRMSFSPRAGLQGAGLQHHGDDSASSSFVDYGALFRRQWMVILACVLLGFVAGIGYLALQSPSYSSSTTVLVRSAGISAGESAVGARTTGDINLDTESQIAQSAKIASAGSFGTWSSGVSAASGRPTHCSSAAQQRGARLRLQGPECGVGRTRINGLR